MEQDRIVLQEQQMMQAAQEQEMAMQEQAMQQEQMALESQGQQLQEQEMAERDQARDLALLANYQLSLDQGVDPETAMQMAQEMTATEFSEATSQIPNQ
jgi:hypothetical protein